MSVSGTTSKPPSTNAPTTASGAAGSSRARAEGDEPLERHVVAERRELPSSRERGE
jgi:hypothetical protein